MVWSIGSSARHASRGQCMNLTEAGAGAIIIGPWVPGQVVTIELGMPGAGQAITLQARLRHRNHVYCGFEFLGTGDRTVKQLRSACAGD
jgi:PilZ domain-containing protein